MKNPDIAGLFEAIADRLEVLGENAFRINSYRKASRVVAELTDDIAAVAEARRHPRRPPDALDPQRRHRVGLTAWARRKPTR